MRAHILVVDFIDHDFFSYSAWSVGSGYDGAGSGGLACPHGRRGRSGLSLHELLLLMQLLLLVLLLAEFANLLRLLLLLQLELLLLDQGALILVLLLLDQLPLLLRGHESVAAIHRQTIGRHGRWWWLRSIHVHISIGRLWNGWRRRRRLLLLLLRLRQRTRQIAVRWIGAGYLVVALEHIAVRVGLLRAFVQIVLLKSLILFKKKIMF